MKKLFDFVFILSVAFILLPSCNWNGYSLNEHRITIATVVPQGSGHFTLRLDDGSHLWPATSAVLYNPRENQRVLLNYTIIGGRQGEFDYMIKINDIWNILTKSVVDLTEENATAIGDDPVIINRMWIGDYFLNVSFAFNWGGTRPHYINLVNNTTVEHNADDVIELEFRHNAYGSTSNRWRDSLVAFDIRPFLDYGWDTVTFAIRVNEPAGEKITHVVFEPRLYLLSTGEKMMPAITSCEIY